jgi:hypothetical protein
MILGDKPLISEVVLSHTESNLEQFKNSIKALRVG